MRRNIENSNDNDIKLLSVQEACQRLGIGHVNFYSLINKNAIKTVKLGARRLISVRALNDFINSLEQ